MHNKRIFAIACLLFCVAFFSSCRAEDSRLARIQETGVVNIGMDAAYPPFEFIDGEGQIAGFDVDFAREIAERMGLDVSFSSIPYDGLYDALDVGRVDMLVSALVPAYGAEAKADFSLPYFNAGQHLIVVEGSQIEEMADLSGRILAVEYGAGGDVEARRWERRLEAITIMRYSAPDAALEAVMNSEAHATLVDGITARLGVGRYHELLIAEEVTEEQFAIAVPDGSDEMLEMVNKAIEEIADDGTLEALIEKWFGPQD